MPLSMPFYHRITAMLFWIPAFAGMTAGNVSILETPKTEYALTGTLRTFIFGVEHAIMSTYVNPASRGFRLMPDSPNVGAGKGGATIGTLGVAQEAR